MGARFAAFTENAMMMIGATRGFWLDIDALPRRGRAAWLSLVGAVCVGTGVMALAVG